MMLLEKRRRAGLIVVTLLGVALLAPTSHGQDAAWEGLINAGRNALQQKNYSEAERHFETALEAAERFPSGDARLGKSYNNLAAVYYAQEDFERAEPLMRLALTELQETLGPNDSEVAQTMKNLAALYYLQGDRREAEDLLKRSLAILEEVHGPNHAFVATVMSNLAGLYQAENRYQDAEPLLTRSLEIWESLLGSDHPDVIRSRSLLTQVREAQGDVAPPETAAAAKATSPRSLTPLAAESDAAPASSEVSDELARAASAVEELTKLSRTDAGDGSANAVPAPALNPIDDAVRTAFDAAAVDTGAIEDREPPTPAFTIPTAAPEPAEEEAGDDEQETAPVAAAIDRPATADVRTGQDETTAVLNKATSPADDVSFAVYLSTLWSVDEARRYWQALQGSMPAVLGDKQLEIEVVAAGDGADPFYRVLTKPFISDPEAQAACEQIRSKLRTHDCSVVVRDGPETTAGG